MLAVAQALLATVDEGGVARARDLVDLGAEVANLSCCRRARVASTKAFEIAGSCDVLTALAHEHWQEIADRNRCGRSPGAR